MSYIVYTFGGGVDYFKLKQTNVYEIYLLQLESNKINKELKNAMNRR